MSEQKKTKKAGRSASVCKAYRLSNQREKNKARKLRRHFKRFPNTIHNDTCALKAYRDLMIYIPKADRIITPGHSLDETIHLAETQSAQRRRERQMINELKEINAPVTE